ncbi:hypothetical protein D9M73_82420 [compost metagenome]
MAVGFLFTADQFGVINHRRLGCSRYFGHCFLGSRLGAVITLDEGALLAHFHLDGARLAGGISLLDFAG